jgi:hypothetical protein
MEQRKRRTDAEIGYIKREWKELLFDPDFREKTYREQAAQLDVGISTIAEWKRGLSNEEWGNILKTSREKMARQSYEIDTALAKKARSGDVAAITLYKKAVEGWSEKLTQENINKNGDLEGKTPEEVLGLVLADASVEALQRALEAKGIKNQIKMEVVDEEEGRGRAAKGAV